MLLCFYLIERDGVRAIDPLVLLTKKLCELPRYYLDALAYGWVATFESCI